MSENGFCLWEGLQRDGGWGLLRSVGLTPSSAPQPPPPVKGTFLFGERRGHFYRWTTFFHALSTNLNGSIYHWAFQNAG